MFILPNMCYNFTTKHGNIAMTSYITRRAITDPQPYARLRLFEVDKSFYVLFFFSYSKYLLQNSP